MIVGHSSRARSDFSRVKIVSGFEELDECGRKDFVSRAVILACQDT